MTLLCDMIPKRDFALPIAARATRILGPISRHLMAQIIPMTRNAASAARPGLADVQNDSMLTLTSKPVE